MRKELIKNVQEWAIVRELHLAHPEKQIIKLIEEFAELFSAEVTQNMLEIIDALGDEQVVIEIMKMQFERLGEFEWDVPSEELANHLSTESDTEMIGITLSRLTELVRAIEYNDNLAIIAFVNSLETINLAYCIKHGIDRDEALQSAYDVISKRTGKMVNGVFVKQEDLDKQENANSLQFAKGEINLQADKIELEGLVPEGKN